MMVMIETEQVIELIENIIPIGDYRSNECVISVDDIYDLILRIREVKEHGN